MLDRASVQAHMKDSCGVAISVTRGKLHHADLRKRRVTYRLGFCATLWCSVNTVPIWPVAEYIKGGARTGTQ